MLLHSSHFIGSFLSFTKLLHLSYKYILYIIFLLHRTIFTLYVASRYADLHTFGRTSDLKPFVPLVLLCDLGLKNIFNFLYHLVILFI